MQEHGLGYTVKEQEWPVARTYIDNDTPAILCLIRQTGVDADPTRNHQVLAVGYEYNIAKGDLRIMVYDPNHPGQDDIELQFNFSNPKNAIFPRQTTGEKLRGFLVVPRPMKLPAPKMISPTNGTVFDNFPRLTTVTWKPVPGADHYAVEVDCYGCHTSGKWSTEVGQKWLVKDGITNNQYTFAFVGAQPGRWRVWAVDAAGISGNKSSWWQFEYTA